MRYLSRLLFALTVLVAMTSITQAREKTINLQLSDASTLPIPLAPNSSVSIDSAGNISASADQSFSCSSGTDPCADVNVSLDPSDGGFFRVNGQTAGPIQVSQSLTLGVEWAARGAWECSGEGLPVTAWTANPKPPSGSVTGISLAGLTVGQTYPVRLSCSNGVANTDVAEISVEVTASDPGIPEGCEGRTPTNMTRAATCRAGTSANCAIYTEVFGDFPGSGAKEIEIQSNQYLAMQFTTAGLASTASGIWTREQVSGGTTGRLLTTISRCPGDFDLQAIQAEMGSDQCYRFQIGAGTIQSLKMPDGLFTRCPVQPNTTYYLNMVVTDSASGTSPSQLTWDCPNGATTCSQLISPPNL
jgi:hypothetical protein